MSELEYVFLPFPFSPFLLYDAGSHYIALNDPLVLAFGVQGSWDELSQVSALTANSMYSVVDMKSHFWSLKKLCTDCILG